jgi:hypothetical protein
MQQFQHHANLPELQYHFSINSKCVTECIIKKINYGTGLSNLFCKISILSLYFNTNNIIT